MSARVGFCRHTSNNLKDQTLAWNEHNLQSFDSTSIETKEEQCGLDIKVVVL